MNKAFRHMPRALASVLVLASLGLGAAAAQAHMRENKHFGKIALTM